VEGINMAEEMGTIEKIMALKPFKVFDSPALRRKVLQNVRDVLISGAVTASWRAA
jgi:hypothetical protein